MIENQKHGIYYNCDEKYVLNHICKEWKLFQIYVTSPPPTEALTMEDTHEFKVDRNDTTMQEDMESKVHQEETPISFLLYLASPLLKF